MSSEQAGAGALTAKKPTHKRATAHLKPWKKGQSGNPGGRRLAKLPTAKEMKEALAHALRDGSLDQLMRAWVQHAIDGNPGYLNAILQRLWPVTDEAAQGRPVLYGIKLELTPEGQASVTIANSSPVNQLQTGERVALEPVQATDYATPQASDASSSE